MFTGWYKTATERTENVIINFTLAMTGVLVVLKLTGVAELSWFDTAIPIVVAVGGIVGLLLAAKLSHCLVMFYHRLEHGQDIW